MLNHHQKQGIITSTLSLVLQKVDRKSAGNYSCVGYNTEGDGESSAFYLKVMCEYSLHSSFASTSPPHGENFLGKFSIKI